MFDYYSAHNTSIVFIMPDYELITCSGGNVLAYIDAGGGQGKSRKRDFEELELTFKEVRLTKFPLIGLK